MSNENLNKRFNWGLMMIIITAFQALTSTVVIVKGEVNLKLLAVFAAYIAAEWIYFFIASNFCGQNNLSLKQSAFFFRE